jgi:two-component system LytT family sensor kinase
MLQNKFRWIYMVIAGIVITFIMKILVYVNQENHAPIFDFLITILITTIVWEGNLHIDNFLNKNLPWVQKTKQRLVVQFLVTMIYTAIVIYCLSGVYNQFICENSIEHQKMIFPSLIIGMIVSLFILLIEVSSHFFIGWKSSLLEVEKYKTANAQAQLENLKEQINPHFLFNNLSVLSSLVTKNQEKALDFIQQLSKVYRYVLDSKQHELISLQDELRFLDSYIYLLTIRFDASLHIEMFDSSQQPSKFLPPMCLQMLVENAIKHNEVSSSLPLHIRITSTGQSITVWNNNQARLQKEISAKTGLQNIKERYAYFTDRPVIILHDENSFSVTLPLLDSV